MIPSSSAMPSSRPTAVLFLLLFLPSLSLTSSASNSYSNFTTDHRHQLCKTTPFPDLCLDSLKLSISIDTSILSCILRSLDSAISAVSSLSPLISNPAIVESQRGALLDCRELHNATLSSLCRSSSLLRSSSSRAVADARTHLSAALTNRDTCLQGLVGSHGPQAADLVTAWNAAYKYVSNALSLVSHSGGNVHRRRLLAAREFPRWLGRRERRLLESGDYTASAVFTVAADGSGNFTTVGDAVAFAPNNSGERTVIMVRAGVYDENVDIAGYKTNIALLGEGSDVTFIRGSRSVGDGWTTFRSATVAHWYACNVAAVAGEGFLARDLTIQNIAGPEKYQAVALRINADFSAVYLCTIDGYQDTLYAHSFRQFYRECNVFGTIDFVFGNAAAVFQATNLVAKKPMPGQYNVITSQARDDPDEVTGFSIQNCSVLASDDLAANAGDTKTYLGRPWRLYSTTVFIESYIDDLVDPAGWIQFSPDRGDEGLDTLYYGEYMNSGPGAAVDNRVTWPGFHLMQYEDAYNFTVSVFIYGDMWLDSLSVPYDDGI